MPGREEIDSRGLSALLIGFLIGTSLVVPLAEAARRDAWMAVLVGGGAGLALAWLYTALAYRFPRHSLIGYAKLLLGRWLGGLVGLVYLWYGFHLGALVLRGLSEFLITTVLPDTPLSALMLAMVLLAAYAVRHGLEVLSRTSQVLSPIVITTMLVTTVMALKEARPERLLPVLEHGIGPIAEGAFETLAVPFGEIVLFALLQHQVRPMAPVRPTVMRTLAAVTLLLAITAAENVAVWGVHVVEAERFPSFGVVQAIDLGEFVTRLDALIVINWVAMGFIKLAVCLYVTVAGAAEWSGVANYRPLVLPIGAAMTALSVFLFENVSEMTRFKTDIWPAFSIPVQLLLPLLLLATAWLRGMGRSDAVVSAGREGS